jgi:hypothetical protein
MAFWAIPASITSRGATLQGSLISPGSVLEKDSAGFARPSGLDGPSVGTCGAPLRIAIAKCLLTKSSEYPEDLAQSAFDLNHTGIKSQPHT